MKDLTETERRALYGILAEREYEAGDVDDVAPDIDDDEDAYWAYHGYHAIKKLMESES